MVEKDMQAAFKVQIEMEPPPGAAAYELKIEKGTSMAFDRVRPHQLKALRAVAKRGLYHKIADSPVSWKSEMRFTKPKPFDCAWIRGDAYVIILFYRPRETKILYYIKVADFERERDASDRKSLTVERARAISSIIKAL